MPTLMRSPFVIVRGALLVLILLFALSLAATLMTVRSARPNLIRFDVPLPAAGHIHVHVGNLGPRPEGAIRVIAHPRSRSEWRLEAWYRPAGARPGMELADLPLPAWPLWLLIIAAPVALFSVAAWRPAYGDTSA